MGFIFDRKLTFHQHIIPSQKHLLYRCCVLPIALYGFQLWFYNHMPLVYPLKTLGKMQRRASIWILVAFKTSPTEGIKAIAGLIPIKLHLQKLRGRLQLWAMFLLPNHLIWTFMDSSFGSSYCWHLSSLNSLTSCQRANIKGYLVDSDNRLYGIFPSFSPFHPELSLGFRIIDNFSDCFSFNLCIKGKNNKICLQQLDNLVIESFFSHSTAIIVTDASIKNDIATSILHTHIVDSPLVKTLHYVAFVTSTEAELFAIRCSIN